MSTNSAGIGISFKTNSKNLKIKWVLGKYHTQWNMTPLAVNGLDLYTGLAYFNIIALMWDNIERDNHGELWINYKREKTEAGTLVPILGPSVAILEKHRANRVGTEPQAVFCWVSNQCVNKNLKIIAAVCRIRKYLTLHMVSHTFATTITLMNDIPIETISKMMGHTKSALPCFKVLVIW